MNGIIREIKNQYTVMNSTKIAVVRFDRILPSPEIGTCCTIDYISYSAGKGISLVLVVVTG
jgi:hypothetical protein